jgi:hypothetical protein
MRDLETIKRQNREAAQGIYPKPAQPVIYPPQNILPVIVADIAEGFHQTRPLDFSSQAYSRWEVIAVCTLGKLQRTFPTLNRDQFYRLCGMEVK